MVFLVGVQQLMKVVFSIPNCNHIIVDYHIFIDQEEYDTNVAVQMYAPGAATGWYAQEPETN